MKGNLTTFDRFCTSWKFFLVLLVLQLVLPPVATNGFQLGEWGTIIISTLVYAIVGKLYPLSFAFQWVALAFILALIFFRNKIGRFFTGYVGSCYLFYAVVQNVALTETYGLSIVTVNVVMMLLVAFVWLRDCWVGKTEYAFTNVTWRTAWMIPVALFCLWFPLSLATGRPDFNLYYLFSGYSAMTFCPITPVFLTILTLCKPSVNRVTYRVTAMVGLIIGLYNMGQFATPNGFYFGIYHLPLLAISLYALVSSKTQK